VPRRFRFEIANQPAGFPETARASWDQLPYDPLDPDFLTVLPDEVETEDVGPRSSVSVALFLVSEDPVNPVAVRVFDLVDGEPDELINTIIVNGSIESGPLLNPNGTINDFELHNPIVYAPDQFNPDQFNPDQYNPDQFNPDLYNPDQYNPDQFNPDQYNPDQYNPDQFNPDQYNPDQFNPDQYNPDQYNPDQFNPDQFNPDQFNPDQFNPDQYNPDQYNSTLTDAGTLHNAEIPKPKTVVDEDGNPVDLVVRLDVNFGVQNDGNTLTPYSVDFSLADDEILALIASGQISTQLIAWQDKQISDVQFCEPALISENRIIAAVNNPDLTQLYIPDIDNNRVGALTYFIAPDDILQNTLRFVGRKDKIQILANALENNIISYVFASQAANTDALELISGFEVVVNDRTPPRFNFSNGETSVFEATGPGGAVLPSDWIMATKGTETITTTCTPALGSTIELDLNAGDMPTPLSCLATSTSNNVTATLNMLISVVDTTAPTINPGSGQVNDMVVDANIKDGAIINYSIPTATDANLVDGNVFVGCLPDSGSTFPLGSTATTVSCTAEDESGNPSDPQTFTVTVQDMTPPGTLINVPASDTLNALTPAGREVSWERVTAPDIADGEIIAVCESADSLYKSGSLFPIGANGTEVICKATDRAGLYSTASFTITISDLSSPVLPLLPDLSYQATSPTGTPVTWSEIASDAVDGLLPVSCSPASGDAFMIGTTTVNCKATDSAQNESNDSFTVTIVDTENPEFVLVNPPAGFTPDTPFPFELAADAGTLTLSWPVSVLDADPDLVMVCKIGTYPLERTSRTLTDDRITDTFSYSLFPVGDTEVICTANDGNNVPVPYSFTITVLDVTKPVITVPTDALVVNSQVSPVVVNYSDRVSVYDAGYPDTTAECLPVSGSEFEWGNTLVTCNAEDGSQNMADSASFTVTVPYLYDIDIIVPKGALKIGSTLPIDWQYRDWNSGDVVDSSTLDVGINWAQTDDCVSPNPGGMRGEDAGSSYFRYSASTGTWQYSLQTKGLVATDYLITISPPGVGVLDSSTCVTLR